jgi:hypothetical protein
MIKPACLLLGLLLIQGCATTRPYPFCYCDKTPSSDEFEAIRKDVSGILLKYSENGKLISFTPDNRWAFVTATRKRHKEIEKIWPRIACRCGYTDDAQLLNYSRCIEYIRKMLNTKQYDVMENKKTGYLYCGGK